MGTMYCWCNEKCKLASLSTEALETTQETKNRYKFIKMTTILSKECYFFPEQLKKKYANDTGKKQSRNRKVWSNAQTSKMKSSDRMIPHSWFTIHASDPKQQQKLQQEQQLLEIMSLAFVFTQGILCFSNCLGQTGRNYNRSSSSLKQWAWHV